MDTLVINHYYYYYYYNLTEKAAIFDRAILAGRSREFVSVTSQLIVESRNDRAENAWVLGCIMR